MGEVADIQRFSESHPIFRSRLGISGIPREFVNDRLGTMVNTSVGVGRMIEACTEIITAPYREKGWLYLSGDTGVGKSRAAAGALRGMIKVGYWPCYWWDVSRLIDASFSPESRDMVRHEVADADCVVFDELFRTEEESGGEPSRRMPAARREVLGSLLTERFEEQKPTIITSNIIIEEVREIIDRRLHRRIAERATVVHVTGSPYTKETP